MKKAITIFVLTVYAILSVIEVVNVHYCHGKLEAIEFAKQDSNCCSENHLDHASCCDNITIKVEFDQEHILSDKEKIRPDFQFLSVFSVLFASDSQADANVTFQKPIHITGSPPEPLYLLMQSFLFYG